MKKAKLRNEKAITLIALVITIIILLILAGVSIATLTGENGILTQATIAKYNSDKESLIEQAKLDVLAWQAEQMSKGKSAELTDDIVKEKIEEKDYLKDGKLDDEGFKDKDGKIIFEYSELCNEKKNQGKTIAELYDGINDPEDEEYNENSIHIGDWVNYTAGKWEESVATPTYSEPFTFGGYTKGQSRDENANGTSTGAVYEGWRIWDISDDKQTITLISAGCPEEYYHETNTNDAYISEYILTKNINPSANATSLGLGTTYKTRNWNMYENSAQYANSARALTKSDLDTWYAKYIDDQYTDSYSIPSFPANDTNKLISTVENGHYYWLASSANIYSLYEVSPDGRYVDSEDYGGRVDGVRVLVFLTPEVKFEAIPEKIEKDGFTYNKWIIESK